MLGQTRTSKSNQKLFLLKTGIFSQKRFCVQNQLGLANIYHIIDCCRKQIGSLIRVQTLWFKRPEPNKNMYDYQNSVFHFLTFWSNSFRRWWQTLLCLFCFRLIFIKKNWEVHNAHIAPNNWYSKQALQL